MYLLSSHHHIALQHRSLLFCSVETAIELQLLNSEDIVSNELTLDSRHGSSICWKHAIDKAKSVFHSIYETYCGIDAYWRRTARATEGSSFLIEINKYSSNISAAC